MFGYRSLLACYQNSASLKIQWIFVNYSVAYFIPLAWSSNDELSLFHFFPWATDLSRSAIEVQNGVDQSISLFHLRGASTLTLNFCHGDGGKGNLFLIIPTCKNERMEHE